MKDKLGIIDALRPFSATRLARQINVSRSYLYNCDSMGFRLPDDIKAALKRQLILEAQQLIKFARSL